MGGATPKAPASAVTTSFFSPSTFIFSISAAAASAIVERAGDVRSSTRAPMRKVGEAVPRGRRQISSPGSSTS
jgi:hypothetical protein